MSESNYNFRQAFKEAKLTKKTQVSLEVDKVLRMLIGTIAGSSDILSEEAIKEFVFCQSGSYIQIYIRDLNARENAIFPYTRFAVYSTNNFDDATNILLEIRAKLKIEEFLTEEYDIPREYGINSFIMYTEER